MSSEGRQQDLTHGLLIERMYSKLAGWRMEMLSFAGRVALLKSVLIFLPVYYMTVAEIPTKTINEMTKIARKFMWGKPGQVGICR